jgi:hypothetical protein
LNKLLLQGADGLYASIVIQVWKLFEKAVDE